MLKSPGPVALEFGPIEIKWYGIIIALAFLAGLTIITRIAGQINGNSDKKEGLKMVDHIFNLSTYLLIGALIGARIYFVLFNWKYYCMNLKEIFMIWQGGLSIHGAIIAGLIVGAVYTRYYKLPFLKYADLFSYGLIFGQSLGRWGNFFNSEAFGSPTNLPWKMYIPPSARPDKYLDYNYFHPTFLYESLWDLLVFILLYFVLRKRFKGCNGAIFFSYLILYSLGRFAIESIRIDSIYSIDGLALAQIISIILIIVGIIGLYFVTVAKNSLDSR